jgi:predicted porin
MQNDIIRVPGQKRLVALAIAVMLAVSGPAFAAVSNTIALYGQANVSYDTINTGSTIGSSAADGISSGRLASNSSHIGLRGSSELGKDWKAVVQAEVTLGTDTGASGCQAPDAETPTKSSRWKCFFDRNTYLGLSNTDYGTLLAGRHDTPYKMATRRLDVFADGIADNRSLMGTTILGGANRQLALGVYSNPVVAETFDARLSNLFLYMSPRLGSFSMALGYSNLTESNTFDSQPSRNAMSLAAMYEQGPIYATIAYEDHTTSEKDTLNIDHFKTVKATKMGLGYKLGILDVGFVYEKSRDDFGNLNPYDADPNSVAYNPCGEMQEGANCSGHGTVYLSAKLHFTRDDAIKLAYTKAGQVGASSTDTGALQFGVGLDHDFNERTTGYFLYSSLKNDNLVRYGLSTASTSGDNSVNPTGIGGASPSVLSIGLKHSF